MADPGSPPSRHRHAQPPASGDRRRRVLLTVIGVVVLAVAAVLVVLSWNRPEDATAGQDLAAATATATSTSPPAPTPAPTTSASASPSDVPADFVDAMAQTGIPLDPHTGWVVAQGICVRLGQPDKYDQFKLSEGVERLFPSVPDEDAHEFVLRTRCRTAQGAGDPVVARPLVVRPRRYRRRCASRRGSTQPGRTKWHV